MSYHRKHLKFPLHQTSKRWSHTFAKTKKCNVFSTGSNHTRLYQYMMWNMLFSRSEMAISINLFHSLGGASVTIGFPRETPNYPPPCSA